MAQAVDLLYQDHLSCPICLDLLKHPVTINCGHSYCMNCIKGCWDQEDHAGVYRCPQCGQTFTPRPILGRNTILAEMVEKLKKTRLQAAPHVQCSAGPGDVVCDVCTGRKNKAIKSCLACLASYCETHFKLHNELNPGNRHKVIDASGKLQEKVCSHHDKLLEVYCRTDQRCICYQCVMDQHRGHDTVPAATERSEKQNMLGETQKKFHQRLEQREKEADELRQAVDSITRSAQAAMEDTEKIFTEMIHSIEKRRSELKDLIRAQEKAAVNQAEGLLKQLEQEIDELRKRHSELEHISRTEDHIHFLQSFPSLCAPPGPVDSPNITVTPHCSFGDVKKAVSDLKLQVDEASKNTFIGISQTVREVHIVGASKPSPLKNLPQTPETRNREEFLPYACQLRLDTNTVHKHLCLSERNTAVTWKKQLQSYPDHPHRFDCWYQVLSRQGLSGRCYWEVEWGGDDGVYIAVAYKGIGRKGWGNECGLGYNDKSWSLDCSPSTYSLWHNNKKTEIPVRISSRIGVYLDHRAGTLSFYRVSDTMTLLHRVQTTFTEPLYPGFWLSLASKVKLCSLK